MDLVGQFLFFLESKKHGRATLVLCRLRSIGGAHSLEVKFMTLDDGADPAFRVGALNLELCAQLAGGFHGLGQF